MNFNNENSLKNNARLLLVRLSTLAMIFVLLILVFTACGPKSNSGSSGDLSSASDDLSADSGESASDISDDGQQASAGVSTGSTSSQSARTTASYQLYSTPGGGVDVSTLPLSSHSMSDVEVVSRFTTAKGIIFTLCDERSHELEGATMKCTNLKPGVIMDVAPSTKAGEIIWTTPVQGEYDLEITRKDGKVGKITVTIDKYSNNVRLDLTFD